MWIESKLIEVFSSAYVTPNFMDQKRMCVGGEASREFRKCYLIAYFGK